MIKKCNNCTFSKHRSDSEKKNIKRRLNVIEGQINGIKQMVDDNRCCDEILTQLSAASKSLKSLGNSMLKSHLETCLATDISNKNYDAIDDVISLLERVN